MLNLHLNMINRNYLTTPRAWKMFRDVTQLDRTGAHGFPLANFDRERKACPTGF
jgi:hypothetical protein